MKRVLFCKRKQGKTNHKSNYLRNPLMHYTLSHPPRFLLPGMTIFKMTLKIRVATKKMPARGFAPDWHFLFKKTFLFVLCLSRNFSVHDSIKVLKCFSLRLGQTLRYLNNQRYIVVTT